MEQYMSLPICNAALNEESGSISTLRQHMSDKDIRSLELQGLIKNGFTHDERTWALTSLGKEVRDSLVKSASRSTRFYDWILRYLLRMNITI